MHAYIAGLVLVATPLAMDLHAQSSATPVSFRPQQSVVFVPAHVRGHRLFQQAVLTSRANHGVEGAIAGGVITGSLVVLFGSSGCEDNCVLKALGGAMIGALPGAVIGGLIGGSIPKRERRSGSP